MNEHPQSDVWKVAADRIDDDRTSWRPSWRVEVDFRGDLAPHVLGELVTGGRLENRLARAADRAVLVDYRADPARVYLGVEPDTPYEQVQTEEDVAFLRELRRFEVAWDAAMDGHRLAPTMQRKYVADGTVEILGEDGPIKAQIHRRAFLVRMGQAASELISRREHLASALRLPILILAPYYGEAGQAHPHAIDCLYSPILLDVGPSCLLGRQTRIYSVEDPQVWALRIMLSPVTTAMGLPDLRVLTATCQREDDRVSWTMTARLAPGVGVEDYARQASRLRQGLRLTRFEVTADRPGFVEITPH